MLEQVRKTAQQRILFLPHAVRQMSRPDRMITTAEVASVIASGEVIEEYPTDPRGASCLLLGLGNGKTSNPRRLRAQGRLSILLSSQRTCRTR